MDKELHTVTDTSGAVSQCAAVRACKYLTGAHSCRLNSVLRTDGYGWLNTRHSRHIAKILLPTLSPLCCLEKYAFSLVHCIGRKVQHWVVGIILSTERVASSWFWIGLDWFSRRYAPKRFLHFRPHRPWPWTFRLQNCFASYCHQSLNVHGVPFSRLRLTQDRRTGRQTVGLYRVMRLPREGRINRYTSLERFYIFKRHICNQIGTLVT